MSGLINGLIEIMKKQAVNYDELLVLSEEKKNVILSNDVEMLQKITQAESSIVSRNSRMEKKRIEIIDDIRNVLNYNDDDLSVVSLAEIIRDKNEAEYQELMQIRVELINILEELKSANNRNSALLESSLDYIDFSVNLVRSFLDNRSSYINPQGDETGEGNFFDAKQ